MINNLLVAQADDSNARLARLNELNYGITEKAVDTLNNKYVDMHNKYGFLTAHIEKTTNEAGKTRKRFWFKTLFLLDLEY